MAGNDAIGINGLFANESPQAAQYADKQWMYLNDVNNGQSLNNQVLWQTTIWKGQLINYYEGFVIIPFTVTGSIGGGTASTGAWDANTMFALRQSTCDIPAQFQVLSDQGQVLSNELTTHIKNNLLMGVENGVVWEVNNADERDFAIDRWVNGYFTDNNGTKANPGPLQTYSTTYALGSGCNTNDNNQFTYTAGFAGATNGATSTTVAISVPAVNQNYNEGFAKRVLFLRNQGLRTHTASGTVSTSGQAVIHLADICDFFRQARTPVINLGLQIQMWFNQPSGQSSYQYPTFMTGVNTANTGGGVAIYTYSPPVVTWGTALEYNGNSATWGMSGCRLCVPSIKLGPEDTQRLSSMLQSGLTKSFRYIQTLTYTNFATSLTASGGQFNFTIPGLPVHPVRIWLGGFQAGILANSTNPCNQAMCPTVAFSNLNVQVNNLPYFRYPLNTWMDQWNQLKDQFNPITGSLIRQSDWLNTNRWHVLDISRLGDRLPSATEPVSLQLTGTRCDNIGGGTVDIVVIVETLTQVLFNFSNSGTTVVVGNLD